MATSVATISQRKPYDAAAYTYYPVVIIGAGESGIAMGCRLKAVLGIDQFRIFDRQSGIGGTWWVNRYPGVACDIPASLYSFSFAQNKHWTTLNPGGREIAKYLTDVCAKYGIIDRIQLNTEVRQMRWIEEEEEWEVTLAHLFPGAGDLATRDRLAKVAAEGEHTVYLYTEILRAKIVVNAVGGLVEPNGWPQDIPGIDTFEGDIVHTARWNPDLSLSGKDVVVIGTGCSAAQVIPELIKPPFNAKSVTQLMRSPPWVNPPLMEPNKIKLWEKYSPWLMQTIPGLARFVRFSLFCVTEHHWFQLLADNAYSRRQRPIVQERMLRYMRETVPEKYHEILTPNYRVGCKRRIFDAGWFQSLQEPNVDLTTLPLKSVQPRSVTLGPGRNYPPMSKTESIVPTGEVQLPADAIILANGYESGSWTHRFPVLGRGGKSLHDVWKERGGAQAYLGIAVDQFPNFFIIYGPNTFSGHSSVIMTTENAVNYSLRFIRPILRGEVRTYEVTETAERNWAKMMQASIKQTVLNDSSCTSWYKTRGGDWNSVAYPFSQINYSLRCRFPVWSHWTAKYTRKGLRRRRIQHIFFLFFLLSAVSVLLWTRNRSIDVTRAKNMFLRAATCAIDVAIAALTRGHKILQRFM